VLAKTHRDQLMKDLSQEFPGYGWENNVGYPTKAHREGILRLGVTSYHRISFKLIKDSGRISFS
jgi:ribonuclease HII